MSDEQPKPSGQIHRGNTGNLRPPWKPGQSGNPGGKPKGTVGLKTAIRMLCRDGFDDIDDVTRKLAQEGIRKALKGDFKFWEKLLEIVNDDGDSDKPRATSPDGTVDAAALPSGAIPPLPPEEAVQDGSGSASLGEDGDSEAEVNPRTSGSDGEPA